MIDPHFFFEGKLSREESSSAFLATLLEQSPNFRNYFFRLINQPKLSANSHLIEVEKNEVDVVLTFPIAKVTILVEVKIASSSKQDGQLAAYYERAKNDSPEQRFICVYVAPTATLGFSEIRQLELREQDSCFALAWDQLAAGAQEVHDLEDTFAINGFKKVLEIVEKRRNAYFERTEDRAFVYDLVDVAAAIVQKTELPCSVKTWKDKRIVELYSIQTSITVSVTIRFEPDKDGFFELPRIEGDPVVNISAGFRPARKYARQPKTNEWWQSVSKTGEWKIAEFDFHLSSNGFLTFEEKFFGDADRIAQRMAELFLVLVKELSVQLPIESC